MGILDKIQIRFQPPAAGSETLAANARTAEAEGGGPRPCLDCGGRLYWADVSGRVHCLECVAPPDMFLVQDYFFLQENDAGEFYSQKLFLDPRETFVVQESPRQSHTVRRWGLPAEAERCGAWAEGLGLRGVWACDRANPYEYPVHVRVDIQVREGVTFGDQF